MFNLFSPIPVGDSAALPVSLLLLAIVIFSVVYVFRNWERGEAILRSLPLFFSLAIAGEMLIASVKGAYPFGGDLRHQFIVFPFLLIAAFVTLDWGMSAKSGLATSVTGLALIGVCLNCILHFPWPLEPGDHDGINSMFAGEVRRYEQTFSDSEAVYLDQFSLIVFFAHHNQERWTSLDGGRYEVREDAKRIVVLRDPHWNVEFLKEELYEELAIRLRASKLESVTLFSVRHRSPPSLPWGAVEQEAFCRRVSVLAARHGLKIEALVLDGWSVFAQFAL
jgi:hypothetical protein